VSKLHRGPAVMIGYVTLIHQLMGVESGGSSLPYLLVAARVTAFVGVCYLAASGLERHRPWARWLMAAWQLAFAAHIGRVFAVNVGPTISAAPVRAVVAVLLLMLCLGWACAVIVLLARPSVDALFSPDYQKKVAAALPRAKSFDNDSRFLAAAAVVIVAFLII